MFSIEIKSLQSIKSIRVDNLIITACISRTANKTLSLPFFVKGRGRGG
jgi:hypothetical protein